MTAMSVSVRRLALLAAVAVLVAAGSAGAATIYKWIDEDGNVHYGDRPAPDGSSERLAIASQPTDPSRVASLVDARREAQQEQQQQQAEAAGEQPSPEAQRAAREERAKQCAMYKERLQQFLQSRRLYREDENGERVYLDEEETLAARNDVQQKVEEYCSN